eukprot:5096603-Lingulodinium_polyedra.AAC.1
MAYSCARPGPQGGPQGGVVFVCPGPRRATGARELVFGRAIEATITDASGPGSANFLSVYPPPDMQEEALQQVE